MKSKNKTQKKIRQQNNVVSITPHKKINPPDMKEEFPLGLDFFSFFVHELKAPLMSLKFQLDDLNMHSKKQELRDITSVMETDLDRLFRFIHDAFEMKEIESGASFKPEWVQWRDVLTRNVDKFEKWIFNEQVEIKFFGKDEDIEVFLDPRWIDSVISNLLVNAIQHSPRGGKIWFETKYQKDGGLFFSITDEGRGLNKNIKDKVFHRFQSSRKSWPNSIIKGTGLGLFIAKSIVEGHGGKIGVKSNRDSQSGCTFYFILPQVRPMGLKKAL